MSLVREPDDGREGELGVKTLPKFKALNAENAELMTGKQAAYAEYRELRDEAQETAVAERNIGSIFEAGKTADQEKRQVKEHWIMK